MVEALKIIMLKKGQEKNQKDGVITEKDIPSGFETIGDVAHMNFNQV